MALQKHMRSGRLNDQPFGQCNQQIETRQRIFLLYDWFSDVADSLVLIAGFGRRRRITHAHNRHISLLSLTFVSFVIRISNDTTYANHLKCYNVSHYLLPLEPF